MSAHTNHQIIHDEDGAPAYVVLPYLEYLAVVDQPDDDVTFPHDVVGMHCNGMPLIKAWRKYLKLTQTEVASKLNITQAAYSQIEKSKPHKATLEKVAKALNIQVEQLMD